MADTQVDQRLYGGMVLRVSATVDAYDTPDDTFELCGPMILKFPDALGNNSLVLQDDNGVIFMRFRSDGVVNILGMQSGSETSVDVTGLYRFTVYKTDGTAVLNVNTSGDLHQLGAVLVENSIAFEEYAAGDYPATPYWVTVGPYAIIKLTSANSMPPLQLLDSSGNVVVKITESGDLLCTGGMFFGDIN